MNYDEEYPALGEGNTITMDYKNVEKPSSQFRLKEKSNVISSKVVKLASKNVPRNIDKIVNQLKGAVANLNAQIIATKLPSSDYNILIKAPAEHISVASDLVVRALEPKVTRKLVIEERNYINLTKDNNFNLNEILKDSIKDILLTFHPCTGITFIGTETVISTAMEIVTAYVNQLNLTEVDYINEIPQIFHPIVNGPFGCNVQCIVDHCQRHIAIEIPPHDSGNRSIVIKGQKEYREYARKELLSIYNRIKGSYTVKNLKINHEYHKNIRRALGVDKILKATKVALSFPSENQKSDNIVFVGEEKNIAEAYELALCRAKSYSYIEVPCKLWIYKILKKNQDCSITVLKEQYPQLWISYMLRKEAVALDGPSDIVDVISKRFQENSNAVDEKMASRTMKIPSTFIDCLNGASRLLLDKICETTGTEVDVEEPKGNVVSADVSTNLLIYGPKGNVGDAVGLVSEYMEKLSASFSSEVSIDSFYLKHLSALCQGGLIQDEFKTRFGMNFKTIVRYQKNSRLTNVIFQGKKGCVLSAEIYLNHLLEKIKETVQVQEIEIPSVYHNLIIGKKGSTLEEITNTSGVERIVVPGNSNSNVDPNIITIMGSKDACKIAKLLIIERCDMDGSVDQTNISLSKELCEKLRIGNHCVLRKVVSKCLSENFSYHDTNSNVVNVHIPNGELQAKNKVRVQGHKESVSRVAKKLQSMEDDKNFFVESITTKESLLKSIIGRGGARLKQLIADSPVDVVFPSNKSKNKNDSTTNDKDHAASFYILGNSHKDIAKTKSCFVKFIKELEDFVEVEVDIPRKFYKKFFSKKNNEDCLLVQLNLMYEGVRVVYPKEDQHTVLKGPTRLVSAFKKDIEDHIIRFENTVIQDYVLPSDHCNLLRSKDSINFETISKKYDVVIKTYKDNENKVDKSSAKTKNDLNETHVVIEGLKSAVASAYKLILEHAPITKVLDIPKKYHKSLIGQKGVGFRKLVDGLSVNVSFPQFDDLSDKVVVRGPKESIDTACDRIIDAFKEQMKKQNEWEKKNFIIELDIDDKWFSKLIGRNGSQIQTLKKKTNVNIIIPNSSKEGAPSKVTLRGEKKLCEAAKEVVLKLVSDWENSIEDVLDVPKSIHGRLRGPRSVNITALQKKYHVEIRFAPISEEDNGKIKIIGFAENVAKAKAELESSARGYLSKYEENEEEPATTVTLLDDFQFFTASKNQSCTSVSPVSSNGQKSSTGKSSCVLNSAGMKPIESSDNDRLYSQVPFGAFPDNGEVGNFSNPLQTDANAEQVDESPVVDNGENHDADSHVTQPSEDLVDQKHCENSGDAVSNDLDS